MSVTAKPYYLPVIVFSQFAGTSLWFAGNAVINELQKEAGRTSVASITSFVQFGFIAGTLLFAILTIADRFKPTVIFFLSSCIAALANAAILLVAKDMTAICLLRFITGFFLAGIYPVGMKIAADWFPGKLGNALGFLVGALVLGTAFPHLLRSQLYALPWSGVLLFTSALAVAGGLILFLAIPPRLSSHTARFQPVAFIQVFRSTNFRAASFGYFGHMWELYTFWAFVPLMLQRFNTYHTASVKISLWSFLIIAAGCAGCIAGGIVSKKRGSKTVALFSLVMSGTCCLLAPFIFNLPASLFLLFLLVWGITVVSDSPQFSSLIAQSAIEQYKGTALTITTSTGFAITIASIQLLQFLFSRDNMSLAILSIGPLWGLLSLRRWKRTV